MKWITERSKGRISDLVPPDEQVYVIVRKADQYWAVWSNPDETAKGLLMFPSLQTAEGWLKTMQLANEWDPKRIQFETAVVGPWKYLWFGTPDASSYTAVFTEQVLNG